VPEAMLEMFDLDIETLDDAAASSVFAFGSTLIVCTASECCTPTYTC
jgi:ribonuclease PH